MATLAATNTHRDAEIDAASSRRTPRSPLRNALRETVAEKDAALTEKDTLIAEKDAAIAEKDALIVEKNAALTEKDAALRREGGCHVCSRRVV